MAAQDSQTNPRDPFRILALDGGGAKGFYTLGVLKELESMLGAPLCERFDLIFGTSTGAIIAALLALRRTVDSVQEAYVTHVPAVMRERNPQQKTKALASLAQEVFRTARFEDFKTLVGIVATRWSSERAMIFKNDPTQAHGRKSTFIPGFGVSVAEAVQASCSAYPFFDRKIVTTVNADEVELIDGGYCANNPTLYAIAEAVGPLHKERSLLRVLNVGVGHYPEPKPRSLKMWYAKNYMVSVQLLQKTLDINTQSMEELRSVLFNDVKSLRISESFTHPTMATDLMEHDLKKLNILRQCGADSFGKYETELKVLLEC